MVSFFDLPEKAQFDFDYIDENEKHNYRFVKYKGNFYDVFESIWLGENSELKEWGSVEGQSYFHAILFKIVDNENVIVGSQFS